MITWTDYMRYRARLRGYDLDEVQKIVRFSSERYVDEATGRQVVVGRHGDTLVAIPLEIQGENVVPVTIHRTTRQQIAARLRSGRFKHV